MAIGVVVRNEQRENLTEFLGFVPLVGWAHRAEFPMLTHQDPYGSMILNQLQVESLLAELDDISTQIAQGGILSTLERVSSPLLSQSDLPLSDLSELVNGYIDALRKMGATTQAKVHRFLWFIGD